MTRCVEPQSHEVAANLIYLSHDLSPYYALDSLIKSGGGSVSTEVEAFGESWALTASYQESGLEPWSDDSFELETVREFRISFTADDEVGQRGGTFHVAPRWPDPVSKGDSANPSWPDILGVNVGVNASNVDIELYPKILRAAAEAFGIAGRYFEEPHEYSNINQYERYVRIDRAESEKVIGSNGPMQRMNELLALGRGSYREFREDDTKVTGFYHHLWMDSAGASELIHHHEIGKQVKHYHPKHPRKDPSDPLYHPKLGVALKSKINDGGSVPWSERGALQNELDETLINILGWAGLPTRATHSAYRPDAYFSASDTNLPIDLIDDPTPDIRREQESVITGHLMRMTESDEDTLKAMTDGGRADVLDLAEKAGWSTRTIYRVVERLSDVLEVQQGEVRWHSRYLGEQATDALSRASEAIERDTNGGTSAWSRWKNRFGIEVDDSGFRLEVRAGHIASSHNIKNILKEGYFAWVRAGRDRREWESARIYYHSDGFSQSQNGFVPAH